MEWVFPVLVLVITAAFLTQFVSICHPDWLATEQALHIGNQTAIRKMHYGLWQAKNATGTYDLGYFIVLHRLGLEEGWVYAVRSLGILGLLFQCGVLVFTFLFTRGFGEGEPCIFSSAAFLAVFAALLLLVEFSVFAAKMAGPMESFKPEEGAEMTYRSSFILCVVSFCMTLAVGVVLFVVSCLTY